ncbi:cyclophane-forming radical SAM/SPASM peptide maturase GrrM/OscB [Dyadobacter subterraneus]|uniref:GRRM system radical SAM/SPASM domain protein n=1 Tax=Dyadobacter subterraneus TaxID=2773304 RepID=A0ABR9WK67_9BACT|nr:cyclophane-forming radical SAM/SPASM peptide maturase GrrM/OscB [Dyadobacter subterraneus]MBE9465519.1 GRRM system radical SAM/SPASM domain protein [Dyadobacter subterraneus]
MDEKIFLLKDIRPTSLVVFQATSFCNINCSYCYLPNRDKRNNISIETIQKTFEFLLTSGLIGERLSILWHMGEPLSAGIQFYERAFKIIDRLLPSTTKFHHSFQTNGVLLNHNWCDFIIKHKIQMGVSIDGPKFLHDKNRLCRNGLGSFDLVMNGINCLKKYQINFSTISVLSYESLSYPKEIFDFFNNLDTINSGFNVEEIEGINKTSSLQTPLAQNKIRNFYEIFYDCWEKNDKLDMMREFKKVKRYIHNFPSKFKFGQSTRRADNYPFKMLNVLYNGDLSTYSPELADIDQKFVLGNVYDTTLEEILDSEKFINLSKQVERGVSQCRDICSYFNLCGGGAPSNKYFENGTFDSTESMSCKYNTQMPIDVVLEKMENSYK